MKTRIKDLLNQNTEKPILEALYIEHGVATDQLRRDPETLFAITNAFNRITSSSFESSDLLRYMFNRRKVTDWPKLGTKAKKFSSALHLLNATETATLKQIYFELNLTSDEFLFRPESMQLIQNRFEGLTGKDFPGSTLVAVIMAKRKRGNWVRIREEFGDIEAIA